MSPATQEHVYLDLTMSTLARSFIHRDFKSINKAMRAWVQRGGWFKRVFTCKTIHLMRLGRKGRPGARFAADLSSPDLDVLHYLIHII